MIDTPMDLGHETYEHQTTIGQPEINETPIETRVDGTRVQVQRWMAGIDPPLFWRDALKSLWAVNQWQICNFLEPSSLLSGVAPVAAGATLALHDQGMCGFVVGMMAPENETKTH